ncbi:diacylglycerol kinase catalytic domain protein [Oesophagostomum dentatum]|uniref:Diacylglycerol kinase catalytic domain protein n=1 Tax=Oesophagostomum dentatum TaxID=61180 RepID=A0A0B1TLU0_OESDE|nr:diacylglycerol kinase catalytic domain protein [Oesophagostomum dentatum]
MLWCSKCATILGDEDICEIPVASRSQIHGVNGTLIADVTSPHGKNHRIVFYRDINVFAFELLDTHERHLITYRLDELLCVRTTPVRIKRGIPIAVEDEVPPSESTLYFYFVYKKDKYRWRLKQLPVTFKTRSERDYWKSIITATLSGVRNRPKNIIVFINPFGGKGKAQAIFQDNVETFFKLTPGLSFEVILTQRANHARDYILEMSPEHWKSIDGLVSVGGDGLFNELLSGALLRTQLDAGMNIDDPDTEQLQTPHIRFGIIGAGSANSIVSTVHETTDYATAAVHIAIGSECNVDVCTVHQDSKLLRISANAISYGWLGDVLRDSERYRWLGPVRYQWSGECPSKAAHVRHSGFFFKRCEPQSDTQSTKEKYHSHYRGRKPKTLAGFFLPASLHARLVRSRKGLSETQLTSSPRYDYHWHAEFTHVICCVIPTVTPFTPYGLAPFTGMSFYVSLFSVS